MLRTVLGVIAGIVAAGLVIWGLELVHHMLHPIPRSVSLNDRDSLGAFFLAMPLSAQLLVAAGWFAGALVGGWVAAKVSGRPGAAWIVAFLVLLSAIGNILFVSHPTFLIVAAFVAPALGGYVASKLARRRGPATAGITA